jgi:hypothetical protein
VLELTRIGIESRNLKMRLESLSSRMDFDERRARALEGVVQYRPGTGPARDAQQEPRSIAQPPSPPVPSDPQTPGSTTQTQATPGGMEPGGEAGTARRRRRRRRGRRGGRGRTPGETAVAGTSADMPSPDESATPPHGDPTAEAALDNGRGEGDSDTDSDSGEDEGPDPSAQ